MRSREPYITDPEHLEALEGISSLVLRPSLDVVRVFDRVQQAFRGREPSVSFPRPHVSIIGFKQEANEAIVDICRTWANETPPLRLAVERVHAFGPPHKVIVLKIASNASLRSALVAIRTAATSIGAPVFDDIVTDDWIFHASVAYCDELADDQWDELVAASEGTDLPSTSCTVTEAELVTFDGGPERLAGSFALSGLG